MRSQFAALRASVKQWSSCRRRALSSKPLANLVEANTPPQGVDEVTHVYGICD